MPLFLTYAVLVGRKTLPRGRGPWALDPNGFEMLRLHGRYTFSAATYARDVQAYHREIGGLVFASCCDWMCEDVIIRGGRLGRLRFVGTKLSVLEHQKRTIDSYLELRALAPEVPWLPVLQGGATYEHRDMVELYDKAGVDLRRVPRVGVGSICRRQDTLNACWLLGDLLDDYELTVHAFGFKTKGVANLVEQQIRRNQRASLRRFSCDSMSWSMGYRFGPPEDRALKNKLEGALDWRERFLAPYEAMGIMEQPRAAA